MNEFFRCNEAKIQFTLFQIKILFLKHPWRCSLYILLQIFYQVFLVLIWQTLHILKYFSTSVLILFQKYPPLLRFLQYYMPCDKLYFWDESHKLSPTFLILLVFLSIHISLLQFFHVFLQIRRLLKSLHPLKNHLDQFLNCFLLHLCFYLIILAKFKILKQFNFVFRFFDFKSSSASNQLAKFRFSFISLLCHLNVY